MSLDELAPVLSVTREFLEKMEPLIRSLPSDPKQLATTAISNGETVLRLACCMKLIEMFRDMIPPVSLTAAAPLYFDSYNEKFEMELTVTNKMPPKCLTTVFSCMLAAIGVAPMKRFLASPYSVNPFVQCVRVAYRLTWMLRCRHLAVRGLRSQNTVAVVNNALRLCSYPDFSMSAQRAALYSALKIPEKVNLEHLAYSIPLTALTDAASPHYNDFKALLDEDRRAKLEDLEHEIQGLIVRKQTIPFFSTNTDIQDSLLVYLTEDIGQISGDPLQVMVKYFLYELNPEHERQKFTKEFANAVARASKLTFPSVRRRFEMVTFVNCDEPPSIEKFSMAPPKKSDPVLTRQRQAGFSMASMFKPPKDFIAETKNIKI